ncbi:MATE family efflux transporter [Hamadaea tsunoensis]|uniref:MATE family efflux transporter n=1 Tax=Hamadaea tsunoensis TaxID=53368 RepID=UPI000419536A|nr:MATE family efflux transporter [Hamadaea tsunoensis]
MSGTDTLAAVPVRDGPGYRRIVALATPLALANGFALSAQWLIVVLIGRFGPEALYVRSLYLPASFILSAFQVGIDISTLVAVARAGTAPGAVGRTVRPLLTAGLTAIGAAAALVAAAAAPLAAALGAHPGTSFVPFLRLMCLVVVLEVPCMILTAALRATGHPGQASGVAVTVMVIQVAGVAVFGGVLGLGLNGFPLAVAASAAVGLAAAAVLLQRHGLLSAIIHTRHTDHGGHGEAWRALAAVGVPVGGTFVVLFLANSATIRVLARFGEAAVAGYGIASTTQIVLIVPAMGLGTAVAILVNQDRSTPPITTVRRGAALATLMYAPISVFLWLFAGRIADLAAPDAETARVTYEFLKITGPSLACVGIMLTLLTVLEQTGSGFVALSFNLCYFAAAIGVGAVLARHDYEPLFTTMAVVNVLALACAVPMVRRRIR